MLSLITSILAAAAVQAHPSPSSKLTKPPLENNLNYLTAGLEKHLPQHKYTLSKWTNGYIPEECKNIVSGNVMKGFKFNPTDFDIYAVKYSDCVDPWIFCHHKSSSLNIDGVASQFSQLPIQMREWVRHVIDVPGSAGSAFEYDGTLTFVRPHTSMINVMIHETGHSLDLNGAYADKSLSNSDNWWNNYDQDSDVPDPYSQTNAIEDVAQITVVSAFNLNVPGGIGTVEKNKQKIFHQYATLETEARNAGKGNSILMPGENQKCTHRLPASKPVPKGNTDDSSLGDKPDVSLSPGITPIDTSSRKDKLTDCTIEY